MIAKENAVVKVLESGRHSNCWKTYIEQLANSTINRDKWLKGQNPADRNQYLDPRDEEWVWHERDIPADHIRGADDPEKSHIKKQSFSLLPRDGKMTLASGHIGILGDINHFDVKEEKYIWLENASSNTKWWLKGNYDPGRKHSVSIDHLRAVNRENEGKNSIPSHNELLICASKEATKALFTTKATRTCRLNLLYRKKQTETGLNMSKIPALIITPNEGCKIYPQIDQVHDLFKGLNRPENSESYFFAKKVITCDQDLIDRIKGLVPRDRRKCQHILDTLRNENAMQDDQYTNTTLKPM